jgi:hypothetical protein
VAASADLLFGLGWGSTWDAIPGGLAFALFGFGFQWLLARLQQFFVAIDP